jgi:hypothetical protein
MHGGARGGSPEFSLVLALVAHSPRGVHLRDLWRMGILNEVHAVIGEVGRRMATRRRTHGT